MANYPAVHWGGVENDLYGGLAHWSVSDYDITTVIAALSGAFWGIKNNFQAYYPPVLGSLVLWLDADDPGTFTLSGSNVSQWRDKSGNGYHCAQSTSGFQPLRNGSVNGRTSVVFDGSDDVLLSSSFSFNQTSGFTVYVVAKESSEVNNAGIFCMTDGTGTDEDSNNGTAIDTGGNTKNWRMHTRLSQSAANECDISLGGAGATPLGVYVAKFVGNPQLAVTPYQDGTVGTIDTQSTFGTPTLYSLGGRLSSSAATTPYLNGHICEIIAFSAIHSDATRNALEVALKAKWGTP